MNILLLTNIRCGKGLAKDAEILAEDLRALGHEVTPWDYRDEPPLRGSMFDLGIFLETLLRSTWHWWRPMCRRFWWIPNPEWVDSQHQELVPSIELILAKTWHGRAALQKRYPTAALEYSGFRSRDLGYSPKLERVFFHAHAGASTKGTGAIREAWDRHKLPYPLRITAGMMPEKEYREVQRSALFHLFPSEYEGYGHAVHEGLGLGALVATLPSWDDGGGAICYFDSAAGPRRGCVDTFLVSFNDVAKEVKTMWELTDEQVERERKIARASFEEDAREFRRRLNLLLRY
jgi:glycosyltransferase involved in cell wall biosynthesis